MEMSVCRTERLKQFDFDDGEEVLDQADIEQSEENEIQRQKKIEAQMSKEELKKKKKEELARMRKKFGNK